MAQEVHIERVLDAPRDLVWKAFTDPDEFAQWFGPVGYTVPRDTLEIDLRVGGTTRFEMVPDNDDYPPGGWSSGTYDEVVENELLVTHEDLEGDMAELFGTDRIRMRIEFRDEDGKTRLVIDQGPYRDDFLGNVTAGWESSFTKLDTLLAG
jgi:uncharacterized protein YndB with AHSA1/START domain